MVDLRAERRRRGKTLRQMADEIGVTKSVLQRAETGTAPRSPADQLRIAEAFGADVVALWPEPDPEEEAA